MTRHMTKRGQAHAHAKGRYILMAMVNFFLTAPSTAPSFSVTVLNSTAVNVSWQV